ncbi:MAG: UDP-N-acetylmuramyl-tripeptide synthetase [Candidatus Paceibacterota bacterium]|jgi:UDP-N-acetylmuramyl-tripeptide synthetase
MLDKTLSTIRRVIPATIFNSLSPAYHWTLALCAAIIYRFPSRQIKVIAVTGTKGKSSTVEILNTILEEAGYKTALSNTIRYKVGNKSFSNLFKMSMPGRFFAQRLLRKAVDQGCHYMIMEITSQGALLYRHRFIELDALVFTNISPEHIEAHGSYENYLNSKVSVAKNMCHSRKPNRIIIANTDDKESEKFLNCMSDRKANYSIHDVEPYTIKKSGIDFSLDGQAVHSHLSGLFNLYNILAAITTAKSQGISTQNIIHALEKITGIPGRVEKIEKGQDFQIIVDYAHTADSLEKFYQVFKGSRNICVLGGTGGGRDTWKRSEMGRIADTYCSEIILTNEDPYDEDPMKIINDVASGIKNHKPEIIIDRRLAIRKAISLAKTGDAILITGKGTDPYIMGPNGSKITWSDSQVAKEEVEKILN